MFIPIFKIVLRASLVLTIVCSGIHLAGAAIGPAKIGVFGPTGLELSAQAGGRLSVRAVYRGSPADGIVSGGQVIKAIQGKEIPEDAWERRVFLGGIIAAAEAGDGMIELTVSGENGEDRKLEFGIPILGAYSETWPVDCVKTREIIESNSAYLRELVTRTRDGLTGHDVANALAILSLLSTGDDEDLDVVRGIYRKRMAGFDESRVGSNTWYNGYQGIAACEYYLRTGDNSVMPLIDAICEAARKWQVHGGWTHWANSVEPEYVDGGLVNAAGTNLLTTLLLAKQCGARVDEKALEASLRYFYRFAGHGNNPYGDHRPEGDYFTNNGKTEQLAVAMQAASKATNGEIYAMARDKCALSSLYAYRLFLRGHTGGIGTIWYGLVSSYLADKKPDLYRNRQNETQWFYDLSRRHDGSTGLSGAARYDNTEYGRSLLLGLTAHLKTLQITGAPASPYGVPFTLPELPWGRPADLAFFSIDGGENYQPLDPAPHIEIAMVSNARRADLERMASHPEHALRQEAGRALRDGRYYRLIEELLESPDPLARHTGCVAIHDFMQWNVRASNDWISLTSIGRENFTPRMFNALVAMVRDDNGPLWLVDQSLIALALASPEQTVSQLDTILAYFDDEDWWLRQSAAMAASPALSDEEGAKKILPEMADMLADTDHTKGRGYIEWMLVRSADKVAAGARPMIPETLKSAYVKTPARESVEGEMDHTGTSSFALATTMGWALKADPELALDLAKLSVTRLGELRPREIEEHRAMLAAAAKDMAPDQKKEIGELLAEHYLPYFLGESGELLSPEYDGSVVRQAALIDKILEINALSGDVSGWKLLDSGSEGNQEWFHTSFEPEEKLGAAAQNRYRDVDLPPEFEGWYEPGYDAAEHGWKAVSENIGRKAPVQYRRKPAWKADEEKAGEMLFMRKKFEIENFDHAILRFVVYSRQGYRIYLNGKVVVENSSRSKTWQPRYHYLDQRMREYLKKETNVIAATSFMQYFKGKEGDIEVYLEGLEELPSIDSQGE